MDTSTENSGTMVMSGDDGGSGTMKGKESGKSSLIVKVGTAKTSDDYVPPFLAHLKKGEGEEGKRNAKVDFPCQFLN